MMWKKNESKSITEVSTFFFLACFIIQTICCRGFNRSYRKILKTLVQILAGFFFQSNLQLYILYMMCILKRFVCTEIYSQFLQNNILGREFFSFISLIIFLVSLIIVNSNSSGSSNGRNGKVVAAIILIIIVIMKMMTNNKIHI
jgi:hypothetical protein